MKEERIRTMTCPSKETPFLPLLQLALALLLSVGVATFLGPCTHADGRIGPCKAVSQQLVTLGALMAAGAAVMLVARSAGVRTAIATLTLLEAVLVFLLPGTLKPLCMMATMRCHTVMKPAAHILSCTLALIAACEVVGGVRALRQGKTA